MHISVSVDKIRIDFCNIRQTDFFRFYYFWALKQPSIKTKQKPTGYIYRFSLYSGTEDYMFIQYINWKEKECIEGTPHKPLYTLRLETAPINLIKHKEIINKFMDMCEGIYFVSADVAYDVPVPMQRVFVMSNHDSRKINPEYPDSWYFGWPTDRGKDAYCRVYDKIAEQKGDPEVDGELTRIEIVYRPDWRIKFYEITKYPPQQTEYYYAKIIDDLSWCKARRRTQILNQQQGHGEHSLHIRKEIKKSLANQVDIDFNQLASNEWANIMNAPASALIDKRVSQLFA